METKPGREHRREGLRHRQITPPVLYFGTPVGLVTTISPDYEPNKFAAAGLTRLESEEVAPPRIAECPFQLEATVTAVHQPATPDAEDFKIVETHVECVHADESLVKDERHHIDTNRWSPLLYVFRHYFGTGTELGRTFRAED